MAPLATGSVFAGYRLEAVAGRGGMGVVYRARQLRPDRVVAVKVIAPELAQDPVFRKRFERESELAATIEHPNVLPVYEVGEVEGLLFIAVRFIEGADFHTLIGDGLDPASAIRIVDQVARALDAAHAHGLVHRDVKPANVLVSDVAGRPHAYLTDFGLTQRTEASHRLTRSGAFMGTVDYAAPEQIKGERMDARTDVYALSCVLYESLTGEVPYPRESELAAIWAHIQDAPPSVVERDPQLPRPIDEVVRRGLAKEPDERFQSAGDLSQAALAAFDMEAGGRRERAAAAGDAAAAPRVETVVDDVPSPAVPAQAPQRRGGGRPGLLLAALAAVAAGAAAAAVVLSGGGGDEGNGGAGGRQALEVSWFATTGGFPVYTEVTGGKAWVSLQSAGNLKVVDLESRAVTDGPRLGTDLAALASHRDRLFVGDYGKDSGDGRGSVIPVDPESGRAAGDPIPTTDPFAMATDGSSLWVTDTQRIQVIDIGSGGIVKRIDTGGDPLDVALSDGAAWVVDWEVGELLAFDAATGERRGRPIEVGARPLSVAVAGGYVWVATEQAQVVRVAVDGGTPAPLAFGAEGTREVAADASGAWVVDQQGNVVQVSSRGPKIRGRLRIGGRLQDVALDSRGAYVLSSRSGTASRVVRVVPARDG